MRNLPVSEIWNGIDPAQMTNWCEKRFEDVDEFVVMDRSGLAIGGERYQEVSAKHKRHVNFRLTVIVHLGIKVTVSSIRHGVIVVELGLPVPWKIRMTVMKIIRDKAVHTNKLFVITGILGIRRRMSRLNAVR